MRDRRVETSDASRSSKPIAACAVAGANSVFYGEKLLTTGNPDAQRDDALFAALGLQPA
jgi:biotin synthase